MSEHDSTDRTITSLPLSSEREVEWTHVLVVVEGASAGERFVLGRELSIGRDPTCDVRLVDRSVSRLHCRVSLAEQRALVTDNGSTNGTFVDGVRVQGSAVLKPGALLQIGDHLLRHDVCTTAEAAREVELAQDLRKAREYVAALIPAPLARADVRIEWAFQPCAALGGDLLGYHWIDDARLALYVLDVCGHGAGPAMHSASVFNALRGQTLPHTDFAAPAQVLSALNQHFAMERHGGMYLTMWYGVLEPRTRRLSFASAGHPPALLLEGARSTRLATKSPPIGVSEGRRFTQAQAEIRAGARLWVLSDGVFEFTSSDESVFSLDEFERGLLATPRSSPSDVQRALQGRAKRGVFEDDFSMLTVSMGP